MGRRHPEPRGSLIERFPTMHDGTGPAQGTGATADARVSYDSPADLKALCQEAALAAMARTGGAAEAEAWQAAVTHEDFEEALGRLRAGSVAENRPV